MDPLRLIVGEHYDSGIKRWPGQELIFTTGGCIFVVDYLKSPTAEQISEFTTGTIDFAWFDGRFNGILCYRFGEHPWHMIPFNPHRDTPAGMIPGLPEGPDLLLAMGLQDMAGSPVLAVRVVSLPGHFADAVGATVARLAAQTYDADQTANESNSVYIEVGSERLARRAGVRARVAGKPICR